MDIGASKEIYDKFNQSMLMHSLSGHNRNTIEKILVGKDASDLEQRQIAMLSVFNVLERIREYSISSNQYEGLMDILKNAKSIECSKLEKKFINEIKSEGDFPYQAEKGKNKALCLFIRNGTFKHYSECTDGIMAYHKAGEYMDTLRKREINVLEFNNFLYENIWDALREKLGSIEQGPFEILLVIMVGYSRNPPLPGMFMMNTSKNKDNDVDCFDIVDNLYTNLTKHFQGKKILVINLTQPVLVDVYDTKYGKYYTWQALNSTAYTPRNFGYLHLHALNSKSMAKLFTESFTDNWVNSDNMLSGFAQSSYGIPEIDIITEKRILNSLGDYQSDSVDSTKSNIGSMLIYKIKVNGSNENPCRMFSKVLGDRGDSYHLMTAAFSYKNGDIDIESQVNLEKKIKNDVSSNNPYDFYTFVISCSEEVTNGFYQEAVKTCFRALYCADQHLKQKLIVIDATYRGTEGFVAPQVQQGTLSAIIYSKPEIEEDSFLCVLKNRLDSDPKGHFDLRTHLSNSFKDAIIKHRVYYECNISSSVFLVSNTI